MKTTKNIEDFTKYILKEATNEEPSNNFVDRVMDTIHIESMPVLKEDKPLISIVGWVFISLFIIGICAMVFYGTNESPSLLSRINWSFMDKIPSFNIVDKIHFSSTFAFSFVFFSMLVIVQLVVIKNYVNRETNSL